ncbi:MAG TPA: hypothetical protein VFI65_03920 [Streptosporangiaceae bacterium]|nr:hypothetical protein [Streptosporangiaceae bacterium]
MNRTTSAYLLSSLAVVLYVAAPATVTLTAHETVRIDRIESSAADGVTASRHGDLLRPGTSTIALDRGTYHFRTSKDARLHIADPDSVTMTMTSNSNKCIDPPPLLSSAPDNDTLMAVIGIKGDARPDHIPALIVAYGDGSFGSAGHRMG